MKKQVTAGLVLVGLSVLGFIIATHVSGGSLGKNGSRIGGVSVILLLIGIVVLFKELLRRVMKK